MKHLIFFTSLFITILSVQSQDIVQSEYSFSNNFLEPKHFFDSELKAITNIMNQNRSFQYQYDNSNNHVLTVQALNKKLFSNFKIVENTYKDYGSFFILCAPLNDGISNSIDSRDAILSYILNNYINNFIFKGRIFQRFF
ncbi:hypothetical protein [Winogradskyella sp.]|uniref:hypothetical protein n=1 Tax=Winogradskyella sp. TaxID=1883156 RepID=UPI00261C9C6F|nr:hypothetical protein [Winogradskyella sp.]